MDLNVNELKILLMKFEYELNAFGLTKEEKSLMDKLETKYKELGGYVKGQRRD